jgi:hypothetical protein
MYDYHEKIMAVLLKEKLKGERISETIIADCMTLIAIKCNERLGIELSLDIVNVVTHSGRPYIQCHFYCKYIPNVNIWLTCFLNSKLGGIWTLTLTI